MKWLAAPNEQIRFDEAKVLRTRSSLKKTGSWLLESKLYQDWKTQSSNPAAGLFPSWLWLHGIPGCGKTILSATVVETLLEDVGDFPGSAIVYFYFDFNDKGVGVYDVIKSLVRQLLDRRNDLSALWTLYKNACTYGTRDATIHELLSVFKTMAGTFRDTYIIVDALDECQDKTELPLLFKSLATWNATQTRVLLTSRRDVDISTMLKTIVPADREYCIDKDDVNTDIQIFLHDELQNGDSGKKFGDWDEDPDYPGPIVDRIEKVVAKNANGM